MSNLIPLDRLKTSYLGDTQHSGKASLVKPKRTVTGSANFVLTETRKLIGKGAAEEEWNKSKLTEGQISQFVESVENQYSENLSDQERTFVVAALKESLEDYGILNPLVENTEINDIIVSSYDDISVQKGRSNHKTDLSFGSFEAYQAYLENLLKRSGKSCTTSTPVVDTAIDPRVRACVTHQSFSPPGCGPMLTLRISRHSEISLTGLELSGLAPGEILSYLQYVVSATGKTVLVAGEVGTGKTTLVRALAHIIPEDEALLIIEDTQEIALRRPFVRTLLTRGNNSEGSGEIPPWLAIRTGMRMAMNRIILGEMRDAAAAEAFVDVCTSGHPGISTIHARSARDALNRLEIFLLRAQQNVEIQTVRRQIANSISVLVYLGLEPESSTRRIFEVVEVIQSSDGAVQVAPIYKFSRDSQPYWIRETGISIFDQDLRTRGQVLSPPGTRLTTSKPKVLSIDELEKI